MTPPSPQLLTDKSGDVARRCSAPVTARPRWIPYAPRPGRGWKARHQTMLRRHGHQRGQDSRKEVATGSPPVPRGERAIALGSGSIPPDFATNSTDSRGKAPQPGSAGRGWTGQLSRMPPDPPRQRRRIVEVPPEWLRPRQGDSRTPQKAKRRLSASLGERVIEQQAQRAERTQQDE